MAALRPAGAKNIQAELLEWQPVSSQHNEAKAGADLPPAIPGAASLPGAAGQPAAASQPSQPRLAMTGPDGPEPARPATAGGGASSSPATGAVAFGGPLPGNRKPWKETTEGRTLFRRLGPIVLWWIWVIFVLFNLIDVLIPDHNYFSLELAAGLLAVTGIAYATALRPRVFATPEGLEVLNPVQDHLIRWGALNGVYLGDAVELTCARPAPRQEKTIYCWALYSGRRSRMKSQQIGVRSWSRMSSRSAAAREPDVPDATQLIAAELGRRSSESREAGAAPATLESRWAWQPIAFICVPAAVLLALLLAR
jgi:Bacterial PH domain